MEEEHTLDRLVADYILARDLAKEIDAQWQEKKKSVTDFMAKISAKIAAHMEENNVESLRTVHGTCYRSTRYSASVQDGEAFMEFVKAGHWDMIERRANSTAVQDYVKKTDHLPPGVNLVGIQTVGIRRPTKDKI